MPCLEIRAPETFSRCEFEVLVLDLKKLVPQQCSGEQNTKMRNGVVAHQWTRPRGPLSFLLGYSPLWAVDLSLLGGCIPPRAWIPVSWIHIFD